MTTETIEQRAARRMEELRAQAAQAAAEGRMVEILTHDDFVYDATQDAYWCLPHRQLYCARAVDFAVPEETWRVVPGRAAEPPPEGAARGAGRPAGGRAERTIRASMDIGQRANGRFVEGSTWWPGKPQIIHGVLVGDSGVKEVTGCNAYNQYEAPPTPHGNPAGAGRWVEHVKRLWPEPKEHEYFLDYCAHMVQRPEEKCNAAIVLSGAQGIGKDAALGPVVEAVGTWNCKAIGPDEVFSAYSPWKQTVMLIINEVRPSKDEFHASSFYNIMKDIIASTAGQTIPLNEKYMKMRHVINVMRVFMTTNNHLELYIEDDDRRMMIMHSRLPSQWELAEGKPTYFQDFFDWLKRGGGYADVGAWLAERDISAFNPNAKPPTTAGRESLAGSWSQPDDGVMFAMEKLEHPEVFFAAELANVQFDDQEDVMALLKSPRKLARRMEKAGYVEVKNPDPGKDARWAYGTAGKGRFRSRKAFVRDNSTLTPAEILAALNKRGEALAGRAD